MRRKPVVTEKLFWSEVRDRKLGGFKFKRQYLIGPYIADFVCVEKKLIVELDGKLHDERVGYDDARDTFLERQGFRVMRFKNDEFLKDVGIVLATIRHELESPSPRPSPPLGGGEGETYE
jgi:very-short-patch-repair endonuclease